MRSKIMDEKKTQTQSKKTHEIKEKEALVFRFFSIDVCPSNESYRQSSITI